MEQQRGKMENMVDLIYNTFKGKKVVVTGHTGFKGTWLCQWLLKMDAQVYGISKEIPTTPSMFEDNQLEKKMHQDIRLDILNEKELQKHIDSIKPDFLFHLAAQPIVSISYEEPVETFLNNAIGYATVLNVLRKYNGKMVAVLISSDKCYQNKEWIWGYRENDELGGYDPYSASKAASEIVFSSFYHSYFMNQSDKRISSVRAGNVIGGGDWSRDRIIPDAVKSWHNNTELFLRRPESVRPWQFVLEPIYGYLITAYKLLIEENLNGECFNFGPDTFNNLTVEQLIGALQKELGYGKFRTSENAQNFYETSLLRLNSDKAKTLLGWKPTTDINKTIELIAGWYKEYKSTANLYNYTEQQIQVFENCIKNNN